MNHATLFICINYFTYVLIITASITSALTFLEEMPHKRKEEFTHEFVREFMKGKLVFKNGGQENMTNLYRALIISAQK